MRFSILLFLSIGSLGSSTKLYDPSPFSSHVKNSGRSETKPLEIDLGYSIYAGVANETSKINSWKGIRFAAPPVGTLRWQAPKVPTANRTSIIQATAIPFQCPQQRQNNGVQGAALATLLASPASEDCLYLNVHAPAGAKNLPVFVNIHGGGYGAGNGTANAPLLVEEGNTTFVRVSIQYRLGVFGFLASDEVNRSGAVNAGLKDQFLALQWIQSYIHLFGGNPRDVTIAGVSAGGGSVMLLSMAYGGTLGNSLFKKLIASSPFLPQQWHYRDYAPTQSYYAFAQQAGCFPGYALGSPAVSQTIFQCLVNKDTETLQRAGAITVASGAYGTWGNFLPVTDDVFVQQLPSVQLAKKQLNGETLLTSNSALEGPGFVPQNITTEADLLWFLKTTFPLFTEQDFSEIFKHYGPPEKNTTGRVNFATLGNRGPTANTQSSLGTGNQAKANNIYAETTFICSSYWLAEAYSGNGRKSYKYQFSVPPALHGTDTRVYYGPLAPSMGPDFVTAVRTSWANFVTSSNPSITQALALGSRVTPNATNSRFPNPITNWPIYTRSEPAMMNLNQTGGELFTALGISSFGIPLNVTASRDPGLRNDFWRVDARSWEGGRGERCDFWRRKGAKVPA